MAALALAGEALPVVGQREGILRGALDVPAHAPHPQPFSRGGRSECLKVGQYARVCAHAHLCAYFFRVRNVCASHWHVGLCADIRETITSGSKYGAARRVATQLPGGIGEATQQRGS